MSASDNSSHKTGADQPPLRQVEGVTAEDDPDAWTEEDEVNLRREKNRFVLKLALLLCMVLLGIGTFGATIATGHWSGAAVCILGVLSILGIFNKMRDCHHDLFYLPRKPPEIGPGVEAEFWGLYHPHWEVEAILILKGYRFFGVFPIFERWMPSVAAPSPLPPGAPSRKGPWPRYWLHFRGVPSEEGRFGHMGWCRRRVHVVEVIESGLMADPSEVWM